MISSGQALTGWVLLQDIHKENPTTHKYNYVRDRISTRNVPGYEVSTIILPSSGDQVRTTAVSYYKRSQNNNESHSNVAVAQTANSTVQVVSMNVKSIEKSGSVQSLIAQAIQAQLPRQNAAQSKRRLRAHSMTDDDGEVLSSTYLHKHNERLLLKAAADLLVLQKAARKIKPAFVAFQSVDIEDSDSDEDL